MDEVWLRLNNSGEKDAFYLTVSACVILFLTLFYRTVNERKATVTVVTATKKEQQQNNDAIFMSYAKTDFNTRFELIVKDEIGEYKSPWWYSAHLGTIIPFGIDHSLDFEREVLHHDDGACVALDWFPRRPAAGREQDVKVCIFLPCLGGNSDHKFAMNFALTIAENSYYTVVVTTRGIGAPLKTSAAWHPAFTDDAYMTLQHVHKTYGSKAKIFFSGFSVGSNIVLRTLLRNQQAGRDSIPVLGACCVCMVGNYSKVRDELEKSNVGRVYSCLMAHKQKEIIRTNIHAFRDSSDQIQSLLKSVFLSEFDRAALSVLYGFSSDEELNKNFSCTGIMELQVPYLGIQPRDDPLHQGNARNNIPYKKLSRNKNFIYLEPSAGNHFGFYEGDLMEAFSSKSCYTWPAKCAVRFFDEILDT